MGLIEGARPHSLYIAGKWMDGGARTEIRSPWDGALAGTGPTAGPAELEEAAAAAAAVAGEARRLPRWKRAAACRAIATEVSHRADEFAELITRESGKPIQFSRAEVARAVSTFSLAAGEVEHFGGEIIPLDVAPSGEGFTGHALRVPAGPVAAISPFNFPLNLTAHKVAPAIAIGAPIVVKPPPQAPLTALLLAEVIAKLDLPAGMISVLHMDTTLAEKMATDPRLPVLSFTGSARVGWHLKSLVPRKKVLLELGGNAPAIIHEDADINRAVARCVLGSYGSAGQVCIKVQRMLVHEKVYDAFVDRFVRSTKVLRCGDPIDPGTVVGPLIDSASADRVSAWVEEAIKAGATALVAPERKGNLLTPALLSDVPPDAKVSCEEVFGPVSVIEGYADIGDAIARANSGRYGLQAGVFTNDLRIAARAADELDFGGIIINDIPMFRVDNMPYGGVRDSGFGREGIRYAMEEMSELRIVATRV